MLNKYSKGIKTEIRRYSIKLIQMVEML